MADAPHPIQTDEQMTVVLDKMRGSGPLPAAPVGHLDEGGTTMVNPTGLCQCGCGQPAPISPASWAANGYVRGQARRFIQGHNGRRQQYVTPDRYTVLPSGCWRWNGYIDPATGYGKAAKRGAHRRAFLEAGGVIPPGFVIDHLCRNRWCVNPSHLEAVTPAENCRRGHMGKKLTPRIAREIYSDGRIHSEIAHDHGVDPSLVGRIKSGEAWARATGHGQRPLRTH